MRARRLSRRRAGSRCISSACRPRSPIAREERKGPRVGAPEGAIQGFLKSAGLASIEDAKIVSDAKKGEFYVAVIEKPGRADARAARRDPAGDHPRAFPGRNRCAGAPPRRARRVALGAPAALDPVHVRRPARGARDRSTSRVDGITAGDDDLRPSLHGAAADQGAALRRLCRRARQGQGRARRRPAQAR